MATKLYVGSLSFNVTDEQLKELFESAGTVVSASVIMDRDTNRSKGFGFVEMETEQEAQTAITTLNGKEVDGRTIMVNIARPKTDRPSRPSFNRRRY
jgi:RNA recognition motif-containing protein